MEEMIDVEYTEARTYKRILAIFVDLFIFLFLTIVTFSLINIGYQNVDGPYKNLNNENKTLRYESYLYNSEDKLITDYLENSETLTYEQKKNELAKALNNFYSSNRFFNGDEGKTIYNERKKEAKNGEVYIFELKDNEYIEKDLSPKIYYDFYKNEVNDHALAYLNNNDIYVNNNKKIFIVLILTIFLSSLPFFIIFYLVLPLTCFKRGRQTLGMKLFKISFISVNALNIETKKYILRVVFNFFIMYILNIFSFLIPTFVSLGMMFFTKTKQNLSDFVFNQYCVDTKVDDIYLDYYEYIDKKEFEKNIKISDKNIKIK